jgi:hypothetical protein
VFNGSGKDRWRALVDTVGLWVRKIPVYYLFLRYIILVTKKVLLNKLQVNK